MKKERKSFNLCRFGFKFRIIINGTTTTAILEDGTYWKPGKFIGIAQVHKNDIYDEKLGIKIAMKAAMSKFHSATIGAYIRERNGFQSRMRQFNASLAEEIATRRVTTNQPN